MEKPPELGTVVSTMEGPTTLSFSFVISSNSVRKGQFVKVKSDIAGSQADSFVVGSITEITRANRYFERAESVAEYERNSPMSESFPTGEWEYTVANVRVHGVFEGGKMLRTTFPVAPGNRVVEADEALLKKFLQLDDTGWKLARCSTITWPRSFPWAGCCRSTLQYLPCQAAGNPT